MYDSNPPPFLFRQGTTVITLPVVVMTIENRDAGIHSQQAPDHAPPIHYVTKTSCPRPPGSSFPFLSNHFHLLLLTHTPPWGVVFLSSCDLWFIANLVTGYHTHFPVHWDNIMSSDTIIKFSLFSPPSPLFSSDLTRSVKWKDEKEWLRCVVVMVIVREE